LHWGYWQVEEESKKHCHMMGSSWGEAQARQRDFDHEASELRRKIRLFPEGIGTKKPDRRPRIEKKLKRKRGETENSKTNSSCFWGKKSGPRLEGDVLSSNWDFLKDKASIGAVVKKRRRDPRSKPVTLKRDMPGKFLCDQKIGFKRAKKKKRTKEESCCRQKERSNYYNLGFPCVQCGVARRTHVGTGEKTAVVNRRQDSGRA